MSFGRRIEKVQLSQKYKIVVIFTCNSVKPPPKKGEVEVL